MPLVNPRRRRSSADSSDGGMRGRRRARQAGSALGVPRQRDLSRRGLSSAEVEGASMANMAAAAATAAAPSPRSEGAQGRVMVLTVVAMVQSAYMGKPLEGERGAIAKD